MKSHYLMDLPGQVHLVELSEFEPDDFGQTIFELLDFELTDPEQIDYEYSEFR